jgi:coniferyl-aldehyde dehydrogenase
MNAAVAQVDQESEVRRMHDLLSAQREACQLTPFPSANSRIDDMKRLKASLHKHNDALTTALDIDFSCRCGDVTTIGELIPIMAAINYSMSHIKKWMKTERRKLPLTMRPASAQIVYQPLGVVGIIVPWNYPVSMTLTPLVTALSAGNRAMIKLSEFTPETNKVITALLADAFDENQVAVVTGEADIGAAFSSLSFDHILFTGSTVVGKHVMRAAAENLTPVTLELGGKSPTIIDEKIPLADIMERIVFGKTLNAGQTCIAPDYILCPLSRRDELVEQFSRVFSRMYPSVKDNKDYTSIINQRQFDRLQSYLHDAEEKGAKIIAINPTKENMSHGTRKIVPHLVLDASPGMKVLEEEIFGPILPIITYQNLDEAIAYINERPRPLALYLFSFDKTTQQRVLLETHSGGVSINDTLMQGAVDSLPFGGIGSSGMGHYHGQEGFRSMSKAKSVFQKGRMNSAKSIYPPYGTAIQKFLYRFALR